MSTRNDELMTTQTNMIIPAMGRRRAMNYNIQGVTMFTRHPNYVWLNIFRLVLLSMVPVCFNEDISVIVSYHSLLLTAIRVPHVVVLVQAEYVHCGYLLSPVHLATLPLGGVVNTVLLRYGGFHTVVERY